MTLRLAIAVLCLPIALGGCATSATVATVGAAAVTTKAAADKAYGVYAEYCPLLDAAQDELQRRLAVYRPGSASKFLAGAKAIQARLAAAGTAACSYASSEPSPSLVNELTAILDAYRAWKAAKAANAASSL